MSYYNLCGMSKEINSLRPKGNKNSLLLNEILAFLPLSTTTINYIQQPGEEGCEEMKLMENSLLCLLHVHYGS